MNKKLLRKTKKSFEEHFKTEPLLVFSPGRINLIGEHTDYNDGFVFPAAINKGIVLAIQKSDTDASSVYALDKEEMHEFNLLDIKPIKDGGWRNYVLGVVAEIQKLNIQLDHINIVFGGDIPEGAGLSSSAALENSVVFGLNELFNLKLSKNRMILLSQKAEHNYVGVKCGIMDQYASMFGKKGSALLLDCRTLESKTYKIDFEDYKLVLINTNVKHELSESAYNERRSVCEKVSNMLGVIKLRDVSKSGLKRLENKISNEDYQKALYIIEENERVKLFSKAIENDDIKSLGNLLYESHNGLSNQYKVSCRELDFLIEKAKENTSILGARMMGAGFGGCTLNLVYKSDMKKFKKDITKAYKIEFGKDCSIYEVNLSAGTKVIG